MEIRKYLGEIEASSHNERHCCVYYDTHDPLQSDWLQCSSMCWLHKDCKVQLGPYCVS